MLRAAISRLARQPALAALVLFLAGLTFGALPTLRYGPPWPAVHDEFSYLFQGETFAQGRLANPPPPGPPELYETFHELIAPRYVSKYPPGQGLALAAGILLGHPIIGVWLVNGLWAMALFWMLRGVAPPGWAMGGALAGALGYGAMTYWGQSYWGGSVLALGGALTMGGALRLWRRRGPPVAAAVGAGVGCAIMALSRPLDGFIFALLPAALILASLKRDRTGWPGRLAAFAVPVAAGLAFLLIYNHATTGSPWQFAHRVYDQTRLPGLKLFVWEKLPPNPPSLPNYIARYQEIFDGGYEDQSFAWGQYLHNIWASGVNQWESLFPWAVLPLALVGLGFLRDRCVRVALLSLAFIILPLATLRTYSFTHYTAAWTAPALLLIMQGARHLCAGRRAGRTRLAWLVMALLASWPSGLLAVEMAVGHPLWIMPPWVYDHEAVNINLSDRERQSGRQQLVAVVYPPTHDANSEWVFNTPDIATQPVVWVHVLDPTHATELYRFFPNADAWLAYTIPDGRLQRLELVKPPLASKQSP